MIIGADPDTPSPEAKEENAQRLRQDTSEIVRYFNFTARKLGAAIIPVNEIPMFRRHVMRMLSSGIDRYVLKQRIRQFFVHTSNQKSRSPWKSFTSTAVQARLAQRLGDSARISNPVLDWIANDFGPDFDLPWEPSSDAALQRLVLSHVDLLFRYPEIVSEVIAQYSLADADRVLGLLSELVSKALASTDLTAVLSDLSSFGATLPQGLVSPTGKSNPNRVRPLATSITEAVTRSQ